MFWVIKIKLCHVESSSVSINKIRTLSVACMFGSIILLNKNALKIYK